MKYAYYKDGQFRIIPDGLMPKEPSLKMSQLDANCHPEFGEQLRYEWELFDKALQHAKDQSVLAEDQEFIVLLINRFVSIECPVVFVEDTIHPFEYEGTIDIQLQIATSTSNSNPGWISTTEEEAKKSIGFQTRKIARLIPKPKEVNSAHSHTEGSEEKIISNIAEIIADKNLSIQESYHKICNVVNGYESSTPEKPDNKPHYEKLIELAWCGYYHNYPSENENIRTQLEKEIQELKDYIQTLP